MRPRVDRGLTPPQSCLPTLRHRRLVAEIRMTQPNVGPSPKRRHDGGQNALPERLAKALGRRRRWVEAAIWGDFSMSQTCARLITALRNAGATDTLAKFVAPIREALNSAA